MKKTVLILGAGASADYDYPLWNQLRQQMMDLDINDFLTREIGLSDRDLACSLILLATYSLRWN